MDPSLVNSIIGCRLATNASYIYAINCGKTYPLSYSDI